LLRQQGLGLSPTTTTTGTPSSSTGLGFSSSVSTSALANLQLYQKHCDSGQFVPSKAFLTSPVPEAPEDSENGYGEEGGTGFSVSLRKKIQLRQEALESLGISLQRKHKPPSYSQSGLPNTPSKSNLKAIWFGQVLGKIEYLDKSETCPD